MTGKTWVVQVILKQTFSMAAHINCNSHWLNLVFWTVASVSAQISTSFKELYTFLHAYGHALFLEFLKEIHPNGQFLELECASDMCSSSRRGSLSKHAARCTTEHYFSILRKAHYILRLKFLFLFNFNFKFTDTIGVMNKVTFIRKTSVRSSGMS